MSKYKLYFRYGTVSSSKTMNLLVVAHNYDIQGKNVKAIKPAIDTRFGHKLIRSRTGIQRKADMCVKPTASIKFSGTENIDCVLVDECQFLSVDHIDQLRSMTSAHPVICYGLRTDYRGKLFPASSRLMEVADSIEEIKTECTRCHRKATFNMKIVNGSVVKTGSSEPDLGCEEKYIPVCWACWEKC